MLLSFGVLRAAENYTTFDRRHYNPMNRLLSAVCLLAIPFGVGFAQAAPCTRPAVHSAVPYPEDLVSSGDALTVNLGYFTSTDALGYATYCYTYTDGQQSPTLRLNPGDQLTLNLANKLPPSDASMPEMNHAASSTACSDGVMTASTTNIHFHGMNIPPKCHQDEVITTMVQPSTNYQYRFQVPANEPPGMYWYHPHPHGFAHYQVLGGASGILIVQGIQNFNPALAGLPERVLVIRDSENGNDPDIKAAASTPVAASKDISLNYVPQGYPSNSPPVMAVKPAEKEFWRVANAGSDTILDVGLVYGGVAQQIGLVALDGVPLGWYQGPSGALTKWVTHILIPPGSRAEFIATTPAAGVSAQFITRGVDTGLTGDVIPARTLANIVTSANAPAGGRAIPVASGPVTAQRFPWLATVAPKTQRSLYFSEIGTLSNITYLITVDGQTPAPYDPSAPPNIVTTAGSVEDWTIENRSTEVHEFHIHQLHFLVLDVNGQPVSDSNLRDTYQVAAWDAVSTTYPSIKVRMDFRDPEIIGTFPYHCHIISHEDLGMMGTIQVDPAN